MKKGNIVIRYEALQTVKEKMVTKYVLNPSFTYRNFDRLKSDLQKDFLERLKDDIARTSFELMEKYDVNLAMIISLSKKGYLDKIEEKDSRIKVRNIPVEKRIRKTLRRIQRKNYTMMNRNVFKKKECEEESMTVAK